MGLISFSYQYQPERIINRVVAVNFPIGSLLTPLLVANGIETGRFQPATVVSMGKGAFKIGKTIIHDAFPEQTLSIEEIVVKSSNVGVAKVALQLPISEIKDIAKSLGIGESLGIYGLIGGVNQEDIPWDEWTPEMHAQPGMHIQINLMQAVKAYLPIANGGELMPLSLFAKILNLSAAPRVLSPQTALSVREMLESAASPTGTAPRARVTGTRVAGKSTTISDVRQGSSRYVGERLPGNTISAFVGMAPTEKPQFLVGVMFQLPQGKVRYGGETAAPVFAEIIRQILVLTVPSTALTIHDNRQNIDGKYDEAQEIVAGETKPVIAGKIAAILQNGRKLSANKELVHTVVNRDGNAGSTVAPTVARLLEQIIQSEGVHVEQVAAHQFALRMPTKQPNTWQEKSMVSILTDHCLAVGQGEGAETAGQNRGQP